MRYKPASSSLLFERIAFERTYRKNWWFLSLIPFRYLLFSHSRAAAAAMSYHTSRAKGGTITITPRDESKISGLIVICHGLGDTAEGFVDVAQMLVSQLPYLKLILPTAQSRPVTMNMGMSMPAWYDITGLDERSNENCPGLEKSSERIKNILQKEHETYGLPYSRMMLSGFSMGGALSLFTGMTLPNASQKLAGITVLSGYLVCAKKFRITPGFEGTPIFHGHGTSDPLVLYANALKSLEYLKGQGATDYDLKSYEGMQHTVQQDEIQDWFKFCQKVLPPDESCRIKLKDPAKMSVKELKEAIKNAGLGRQAIGLMEKIEYVKLLTDYRNKVQE